MWSSLFYVELIFYDEWFCVECQDNDRICYPARGSEEDRRQHDYINYYYEQKEKFEKKFLNRKK
jgi:hypothetical protein